MNLDKVKYGILKGMLIVTHQFGVYTSNIMINTQLVQPANVCLFDHLKVVPGIRACKG